MSLCPQGKFPFTHFCWNVKTSSYLLNISSWRDCPASIALLYEPVQLCALARGQLVYFFLDSYLQTLYISKYCLTHSILKITLRVSVDIIIPQLTDDEKNQMSQHLLSIIYCHLRREVLYAYFLM